MKFLAGAATTAIVAVAAYGAGKVVKSLAEIKSDLEDVQVILSDLAGKGGN